MVMTVDEMVKAARSEITEIDVARARELHGDGCVFVDVREPGECAKGAVEGAVAIPRGLLEFKLGSEPALADRAAPVVVYCQSGGRAALAAQTLKRLGYTQVMSIAGGYGQWCAVTVGEHGTVRA